MNYEKTKDSNLDLDAVVAARQPLEQKAMPAVGPALRVRTSPALRSLVPTRLVIKRAVARGNARWERSPGEREAALKVMDAVVGGTHREPDIAELARQYLVEEEAHRAFFWQPWPTERMDAASTERLERTLASPRALILSSCHCGPIHHHTSPISSRGEVIYAVAGQWFFQTPSNDYWGRRLARWWRDVRRRNMRLISVERAFPVIRLLLEQGETVLIYFDMPGSRRTQFLGKPVMLASGTAQLAAETDALVLPIHARRVGHRVWTDIGEPLDPRDFAGAEELHEALAAVHERWILEFPSGLEDPGRAGAWENGASRREWSKPDGDVHREDAPRGPATRPDHLIRS
jgi:hypothetical protein